MKREEQAFQQAVIRYLDVAVPALLYFHVPNSSGNRGPRLGGILKSMGLLAGTPDLVFVLPNGRAAFLELKASAGSLSAAQKAFRDHAVILGARWAVARSLADVEANLKDWLAECGWTLAGRIAA